jgi:Tfp pilus assembly protein PilN
MRSVNLIPPDERRGDSAPLRTGVLVYVLVGGLTLLLLGIVAVALTGKQISDRESQKASLQQELATAKAKADTVQAFTDFRTVQENRATTVASLAQSRFDWSRVLQELARVLPGDIQLNSVTGTVSPDVQISSGSGSGGSGSNLRGDVSGPALEIVGCAPSQDAVAGFVSALEDVDGVTRVGVDSSKLPAESSGSAPLTGEPGDAAANGSGSSDCQTGPTIVKFSMLAAFDAVPAPAVSSGAPSSPALSGASSSGGSEQVASASTSGTGG